MVVKNDTISPERLALQFYAYGYALALDAGFMESYWSKDHHGYHQSSWVLIRFYPDIRKEISLFMLWNLW